MVKNQKASYREAGSFSLFEIIKACKSAQIEKNTYL